MDRVSRGKIHITTDKQKLVEQQGQLGDVNELKGI